jgi:NAD(P)-dependent dehydrogenase (short-subunit alcohol dehydrogenase family)
MIDWSRCNWFVTGASSGFGLAAATTIAARGGRVVATARDPSRLVALSNQFPGRILPLRLDVTIPEEVAAAVDEASAWGGIDVLLNNAGYGFLGGVEESLPEEIAAQFAVNYSGAIALIQALLPSMRRRGAAYIVNMSSISGARGFAGAAFYAASKFAMEGLSEALADELRPFGIGVLIVQPGYFRTDFSTRSILHTKGESPDYPHLAERRQELAASAGAEPGDPNRAIDAILACMQSPRPPRRLALGSDAYKILRRVLDARSEELEAWKDVTESTDFSIG